METLMFISVGLVVFLVLVLLIGKHIDAYDWPDDE